MNLPQASFVARSGVSRDSGVVPCAERGLHAKRSTLNAKPFHAKLK
jgi:hypothetical protein